MKSIDFWRLPGVLSVVQAALLTANHDPSEWANVEELDVLERPKGYEAVKTALKYAILTTGELKAKIKHPGQFTHFDYQESGEFIPDYSPDWNETTVTVKDLKDFLSLKGWKEGFFFTENKSLPDYLDALHPCYSPKLAAAIQAWTAISGNADLPQARSVKYSLTQWLNANAARFGHKGEKTLSGQTIKEIAKIANWDMKGGAPRTSVALVKDGQPTNIRARKGARTIPPPKPLLDDDIPY